MTTILIATGSSGMIAFLLGVLLIRASKVFKVETDEKVETIISMLPGVNCGACGYPGCAQFAKAVNDETAALNGCTVGGASVAENLANFLGRTPPIQLEKTRAFIFCHGHNGIAKTQKEYNGASTCSGAAMVGGGTKDCSYGCVGFLDCKRSCNFDAIVETDTGIPSIVASKCTSCGACVSACPLKLIEIHPESQKYHVYCKSHDKGAIAKKNCDRACIACNICIKNTGDGGMTMNNYLAETNYTNYILTDVSINKCPTKAITDENVNVVLS